MDATDANLFASVVLLLWVPITLSLFVFLRPPVAVAVAFVVATLFLPERVIFDLPVVPPLNKFSITSLCVLVGCLWRDRDTLLRARRDRVLDLLLLVLLVSSIGTAFANKAPLHYGPTTLNGLSMYDAFSTVTKDILFVGIPFFVARAYFRDRANVSSLFLVLIVAALVYTGFILVELRFSPQWHKWIYGFHQHRFDQAHRFGGWRPMVFMRHGLAVAMFLLVATLAAVSQARIGRRILGVGAGVWAAWLVFVLVLCKSAAAIVYGLALVPVAALLKTRSQASFAVVLAAIVVTYPVMRANDWFPTEALTSWAASVSADRAQSLGFRFFHEDALMERARQQYAFGWGGYRRNRVFDDEGRDRSVTDGYWILQLGSRGIFGFVAAFGLLLVPVYLARRRMRGLKGEARFQLGTLTLVVAIIAIDLIPNGLFTVLPFFLAGALAGAVGGLGEESAVKTPLEVPESVPVEQAFPARRAPESFY